VTVAQLFIDAVILIALLALSCIIFCFVLGVILDLAWRHSRRQAVRRQCPICEINRSKEGHHV
jgi:hypothetical protein